MLKLSSSSPFHIKQLAPSLRTNGESVTLNMTEFRRLVEAIAESIRLNEKWYLQKYPDVKEAVDRGSIASARQHFIKFGFAEGRLPYQPKVDEAWYLKTYSDVADGVKAGRIRSGAQHFLEHGAFEGRLYKPPR